MVAEQQKGTERGCGPCGDCIAGSWATFYAGVARLNRGVPTFAVPVGEVDFSPLTNIPGSADCEAGSYAPMRNH